ncbi:hypothetical protein [Pseudoalteromonas luteoviolacea]|uniref:DUF676 domain-containing protein n=1 Tax=Pseudoalteromonas luteoviolacea S4054 TaxID=1129367 RepID=A0A0F6AHE1_9GAMM|nr:hypothetical protein [Pseudoalteromonas luteoviolacea]AOT07000.1 hypothetical protein S4054249_03525 [Pseudoalteromonas luteoviolacea]AOT11918.1 hypothetical protein S40542_03525 [Pseudoalteromonas luteoviolacea]AOT16830.1 hypothetical protein S4054_03525 [Pseudoalteromonas luteoviolacea]KKE85645.1 hypothetical protein N479_25390 [Pseudoalteromonas luteoviolacea S4054]KZN78562.1 hypothetical protein N481_25915 [Pseudoalteromonas luteoviolacea S4047-1]
MKKHIILTIIMGLLSFQATSSTIDGYPLKHYTLFEEWIDVDLWDNYRTILYHKDSNKYEIVALDVRTPHFGPTAADESNITHQCSIENDPEWRDLIFNCAVERTMDASIITSKDNKFDKPVYFISGADITFGSQTPVFGHDKLYSYWNNNTLSPIFKSLLDSGKDIVFLSPKNGDYTITADFFNYVKEHFQEGDYHSSLIGFSYGGLIGKQMINFLEEEGGQHNIYNFISFDAPHKGANIPYSLTENFRRVQKRLSQIAFCQHIPACEKSEAQISELLEQLTDGVAAKLLVTGDQAGSYYTRLANTPYSALTRNVAFSNGSYTGDSKGLPSGTELIEFKVDFEPYGDTNYSVQSKNIYQNYKIPHYYTTHVFDNAPGSYAMSGAELDHEFDNEAKENSSLTVIKSNLQDRNLTPTFIPTVSALDMNTSELDRGFDLSSADTPFDKVYAVNGKNLRHDDFSYHASSLYYEINKKEIDTAIVVIVTSLM